MFYDIQIHKPTKKVIAYLTVEQTQTTNPWGFGDIKEPFEIKQISMLPGETKIINSSVGDIEFTLPELEF